MKQQLSKYISLIQQNTVELNSQFGVKRIAIFGSTARGQATAKSDIDLIMELIEPIGFFEFLDLEEKLSKLLGKRVDLITKKALKPAIKRDVLKEAVYV